MIQIRWQEKQAMAKLAALDAALSGAGLAAVIKGKFSPYVQTITAKRFASEGDDATGRWAPLSPATRRIRFREGFPPAHPINVRTGELKRHATTGTFQASMVGPYSAKMRYPGTEPKGELLNKMIIAQQGASGDSTHRPIPPRPVLAFGAKDVGALLAVMKEHLIGVMRAG